MTGVVLGQAGKGGALKVQLTETTGTPMGWSNEGEIQYRVQCHDPVKVRLIAAWHDHREQLPEFTQEPEQKYYKLPVWSLDKPAKR